MMLFLVRLGEIARKVHVNNVVNILYLTVVSVLQKGSHEIAARNNLTN